MRFRCHRSPRTAIALICGCTLVSLCLYQRNLWRYCVEHGPGVCEQFIGRYELLCPFVPAEDELRFMVDKRHLIPELMHPDSRMQLAQYALSPRRVARNAASHWVIVDSDRPEIVPEFAAANRWSLVVDLRNGVRLYRTDARR